MVYDMLRGSFKNSYDNSYGYRIIGVYSPVLKKTKILYLHRVVASTFLGFNDGEVNHKDGNKTNNSLENLEWVTSRENTLHGIEAGTVNRRGRANFSLLTKEDLVSLSSMLCSDKSLTKIAEELGKPRTTISSAVNGRSNKEGLSSLIKENSCGDLRCRCFTILQRLIKK